MRKSRTLGIAFAVPALLLTSCGGGGSGNADRGDDDSAAAPEQAASSLALIDILADDLTWTETATIPDLPAIRQAARHEDGSVWILGGGQGDPLAAVQIDPDDLDVTTHEFPEMTGPLNGLIDDGVMWAIDIRSHEYGSIDLDDASFSGPFLPEEIVDPGEAVLPSPRLLTTGGAVWIQQRFMLWRIDPDDPGTIAETVDIRDVIEQSTARTDFPPITVVAAGDRLLVEADRAFYLVDPASWEVVAMADLDVPPVSTAIQMYHSVLPTLGDGAVAYTTSGRELVAFDLADRSARTHRLSLTQEPKSRVENTIFGIASDPDGVVAVAGNHTDIEVVDPRSGTSNTIGSEMGSDAEVQVLIVGTTVWSWPRNGGVLRIWSPELD